MRAARRDTVAGPEPSAGRGVVSEPPSHFQHGVASDAATTRVVIWTRLSGARGTQPVAVRWRVLEADGRRPIANGQSLARPDANWTVRANVRGLRPDTTYLYDFEVAGERSPEGRTRTLPAGGP